MKNKDRILFFASGDFAYETFAQMLYNNYNVVGLVTSMYTPKFQSERLSDLAQDYGIETYYVKPNMNMEEDGFFLNWLDRRNADTYCVISFKKLPKVVVDKAKKCAFNIHGSLLPFLKGAAPINWAIRFGYKETGLTAIMLSDKIDCGDIIANRVVKINDGEKFTSLFKRMGNECVDLTFKVIDEILTTDDWKDRLIKQPMPSNEYDYLAPAKKIDKEYFMAHWTHSEANEFKHCVDSVDDIGWNARIVVFDENMNKTKEFQIKIWDVEVSENDPYDKDCILATQSDGKTYIKVNLMADTCVYIKKIQLVGKKVLNVEEFLQGFRYFGDKKYTTIVTDLCEIF